MFSYSRPLFSDGDSMIVARRNKIFSVHGGAEEHILTLPVGFLANIFLWSRLISRVFRLGVYRATSFGDTYFFCINRKLYSFNKKTNHLKEEFGFAKGHGPLSFCDGKGLHQFDDTLYFGEYFSDDKLDRIRILKRSLLGEWVTCFTFEEGTINHIHSLIPDKVNNCIWILTGDFGTAAAIYRAADNFRQVELIIQGRQKYRACVAFPYEGGLIYATDTQFEKNSIRRLYKGPAGWLSEKLYEVNGPVVYGCELRDYYMFSTTVEPGDSKSSFLATLLDREKGPGIILNQVEIVALKKSNHALLEVLVDIKDLWPSRLCQFGSAIFVGNSIENNNVHAYFTATQIYEGRSKLIDLDSRQTTD